MTNWQPYIRYDELKGIKIDELLVLPAWPTANRPSGGVLEANLFGINTDITSFPIIEWYDGTTWRQVGASLITETDPIFTASFVSGITSLGAGLDLTSGVLSSTITQYTDEMAQDAVGNILSNSVSVNFTYNDGANTITAAVSDSYIRNLLSGGTGIDYVPSTGVISLSDSYVTALFDGTNYLTYEPTTAVVRLGGYASQDTILDTRTFILNLEGATVLEYPYQVVQKQYFQSGTGIMSFMSWGENTLPQNIIRLGINYTGAVYHNTLPNPDQDGYFGDRRGYWIGTNLTGNGSFGLRQDDQTSKNVGVFFHTDDTGTDGISIFARPATNANVFVYDLPDYKALTVHTDTDIQLWNYPNTRDDGTPVNFLGTDANGFVKSYPVTDISGGSGEVNTASNLGGGLANWDSKSGVDLRFNTFAASDFDLASNVISIDATLKSTWNAKQNAITLTTIGTSGAATFDGTTLNIPNYTTGGSGTVTSVGVSISGALGVTGSPVTTAGTLAFAWQGSSSQYVAGDGSLVTFPTIPSGTVTSFAFTDGNGFDGTVSTATSTPTLSLTTTVTNKQVMFSNSGAIAGDTAFLWDSSLNKLLINFTSDQGNGALQVDNGIYGHNSVLTTAGGSAGAFISSYNISSPTLSSGSGVIGSYTSMTLNFTGNTTVAGTDPWSGGFNQLILNSTASSTISVQAAGANKRSISANNSQVAFLALAGGITTTVSEVSSFRIQAPYQASGTNWVTGTNYYGLFIENQTQQLVNTAFLPNRWAIYQEGSSDNNAFASTKNSFGHVNVPTSAIDITGASGATQLRLRTSYTPTSSADTNGNVGDICWDSTSIYWKTPSGWLKAVGSTF